MLTRIDCPNPEGNTWCDEPEDLSQWDAEKLLGEGVSRAVYWYQAGSYDGTGYLLAQFADGGYGLTYLGHCSCYGPLDDGSIEWKRSDTLDELDERMTGELRKDAGALVEWMRSARVEL